MSERTIPKQIVIMDRLLFVMILALIGLLIADFVNKLLMLNMLGVGTLAITHAF